MFLIHVNKRNLSVGMGAKGKCIKLLALISMQEIMDSILRQGSTFYLLVCFVQLLDSSLKKIGVLNQLSWADLYFHQPAGIFDPLNGKGKQPRTLRFFYVVYLRCEF